MTIASAFVLALASANAGPAETSPTISPAGRETGVPPPPPTAGVTSNPAPEPSPEPPSVPTSGGDVPPSGAAAPEEDSAGAGEIVVTARQRHVPGDPLKSVNAVSFRLTQKVDDVIVGPAARAYKRGMPKPLRSGIRNFLNNLREPVVFANYLVQLKPGKAAETVGRFAINSSIGLAGVFDVAKRCPFNLPWRPNGFSDTLGVYGIQEGPYLFLPLIGPTTVRELVGGAVDRVASPIALGGAFRSRAYVMGSNAYRIIDRRAEEEDELAKMREAEDPYSARRDQFLKKRQDRVERLKGNIPAHQRTSVPADPNADNAADETAPQAGDISAQPCTGASTEQPTFSGLRIGGSIGLSVMNEGGVAATGGSRRGLIVRGIVGYDLRIGKRAIVGAEIGTSIGDPDIRTQPGFSRNQRDLAFSFEASARVGIVASPQLLLFGKSGWAAQRVTEWQGAGGTVLMEKPYKQGFLWGVGAEYALLPRTALRAEFDCTTFNGRHSRNRIMGGVSFRF